MRDQKQTQAPDTSYWIDSGTQISKRKRILIAESDGFVRMVLMLLFRIIGLRVDFTSNGLIALRKLRRRMPDVLLVDFNLSGLSGLELIKLARKEPYSSHLRIYVFTHTASMKRRIRKELLKTATAIVDKGTVSREDLVKTILGDLAGIDAKEKAALAARAPAHEEPAKVAAPVEAPAVPAAPIPAEAQQAQPLEPEEPEPSQEMLLPGAIEEIIRGVRSQLQAVLKAIGVEKRLDSCRELLSRVCSLANCAEIGGLRNLARQARALEAFLNHLGKERPKVLEATLPTVTSAVAVLGSLSSANERPGSDLLGFSAVVIDESPASSKSLSEALVNVGISPLVFSNASESLEHLASNPANLVIANVQLPELHGLEPEKIRQLPYHAGTPVIFVSESIASNDTTPARSIGAPPLDKNPLLLTELVMKALNEVQRKAVPSNLAAAETPPPTPPVEAQVPAAPGQEATIAATPASNLPAGSSPAQQPSQSGNGQPTILFIEDDPFALKVYRKGLKRAGFHVEVAEDGLLAIELLTRTKPDLVVLDLMLPKVHGLDVLKHIRQDATLRDTPVIVLSNAYVDQLAVKAKQIGANCGVSKIDCTPARLLEMICQLLGRAVPVAAAAPVTPAKQVPGKDEGEWAAETAIWVRQAGLRKAAPREMAKIRKLCLSYIKATDAELGVGYLTELYRQVRYLSAHAALIGFTKIAHVSSALEGLLFELMFKESEPTSSIYQTIAQSVDFLDRMVQTNDTTFIESSFKRKVLVIDDDAVCNLALVTALKRGSFEVVGVQDPIQSLEIVKHTVFDLVLLDINMPNLNGFEICEHLRRLPEYKSVPVVFITNNAEFRNRARSVVSGGNDLIAKPVSPLELILKVTMHLLRDQRQGVAGNPAAEGLPAVEEAAAKPAVTWSAEPVSGAVEAAISAEAPMAAAGDSADSLAVLGSRAAFTREVPGEVAAIRAIAEEPGEACLRMSVDAPAKETVSDKESEIATTRMSEPETPNRLEPLAAALAESAEGALAQVATTPSAQAVSPAGTEQATAGAAYQSAPAPESAPPSAGNGRTEDPLQKLQAECSRLQEALAKHAQERETLVNRIFTSENDLHRAQVRLQRRQQTLEDLQKQLDDLKTQGSPESGLRLQELEKDLSRRAGEMEKARAEGQKQAEERQRVEVELRRQLEAAEAATRQSEAAHKQAQERAAQLEKELAGLRQGGEALNRKFTEEQQQSSETGKQLETLQKELSQRTAELEQARAEARKQGEAHGRAESELRQQVQAFDETAKQSLAAREQAQVRVVQLEQELAGLQRAREELNCKFAYEQQQGTETGKQLESLKRDLSQRTAELEKARAEAQKLTQAQSDLHRQLEGSDAGKQIEALNKELSQRTAELEQARAEARNRAEAPTREESDLRQQLEASVAAAKQSKIAHEQAEARAAQLEQELAGVLQAGAELNRKFTREQQHSVKTAKQLGKLKDDLGEHDQELAQAKAEAQKQAEAHERAQSELRGRLEAAQAAVSQSEAAHKQAQARAAELEQQLAETGETREKLNRKLAEAQQRNAETDKELEAFTRHLSQRSADLQQARAEAQEQSQARARAEMDLRRQLEIARQSDSVYQEAQARAGRLEQELAGMRQAGEELSRKLAQEQQQSAATGRLLEALKDDVGRRTAELEEARTEARKRAEAQERADFELRSQAETARTEAERSRTLYEQTQAQFAQLETDLAGLLQSREELKAKLDREEQTSAALKSQIAGLESSLNQRLEEHERAKGEFEKQVAAHAALESDLRQQMQVGAGALVEARLRVGQLEQELAGLGKNHEELKGNFAKEQERAAVLRAGNKDLEAQLQSRQTAHEAQVSDFEQRIEQEVAALARVTADLARERGERQRGEERTAILNVRLQELHAETCRLLQAQKGDREYISGLEAQLLQRTHELTESTAALQQQQSDYSLAREQLQKTSELNAHLRKNLSFFEEAHQTLKTANADLQSRLQAALDSLREVGASLHRETAERERLATALEGTQRELQSQCQKGDSLRTELVSTIQELQGSKSSLQHEAAERQRLAVALDGAQRDVQAEIRKRQTVETELQDTVRELRESESRLQQESGERQRLAVALDGAQHDLQAQGRKREALEKELQSALEAVTESKSKAERETAECQRLNEALAAARLELKDHAQRAGLDVSKLQSAMEAEQVERKRRETQVVRMRHLSLDAMRRARLLRNTLRRQTWEPVDKLSQSARSLLQLELGEGQKKLAEAILQDALLLQTRLQELEVARAGSNGSAPTHSLVAEELTTHPEEVSTSVTA